MRPPIRDPRLLLWDPMGQPYSGSMGYLGLNGPLNSKAPAGGLVGLNTGGHMYIYIYIYMSIYICMYSYTYTRICINTHEYMSIWLGIVAALSSASVSAHPLQPTRAVRLGGLLEPGPQRALAAMRPPFGPSLISQDPIGPPYSGPQGTHGFQGPGPHGPDHCCISKPILYCP